MEIRQKKLSNVHTFKFGDEKFNFAFRDRSGSGDADIAYADLPFKTSVRIDDNT